MQLIKLLDQNLLPVKFDYTQSHGETFYKRFFNFILYENKYFFTSFLFFRSQHKYSEMFENTSEMTTQRHEQTQQEIQKCYTSECKIV